MISDYNSFEGHKDIIFGSNLSQVQSTSNSQDIQTITESVRPHSDIQNETKSTSKRNLFDTSINSESSEASVNDSFLDSEKKLRTPTLIRQVITPTSSGDNRDGGKIEIVYHDIFCMINISNICVFYIGNIAFQKSINRNIIVMKHDLKNIQENIDNLFAVQQQILDKLNNIQSETLHFDGFDNTDDLMRINNDADLDTMEDKLTNEQKFRSKVVIIRENQIAYMSD